MKQRSRRTAEGRRENAERSGGKVGWSGQADEADEGDGTVGAGRMGRGFRWFAGLLALAALVYGGILLDATRDSRLVFSSYAVMAGLAVLLAGVTLYLLFPLLARLRARDYLLVLGFVGGVLRLGWALWMDTPPISDFEVMHTAAVQAAGGDFAFALSEYFVRWNYQLGFTFYQALVVKLFGNSLLVLELLNGLFSLATAYVVYGISRTLFGEKAGRLAGALYAVYAPPIVMGSVLTNQNLSTFLLTLGVYFAVAPAWDSSRLRWLGVGICFGLGHLIRPLGSFYLVCYLLFVVLSLFLQSYRENKKRILARAAAAALGGVIPEPLAGREPYWKVMVGLNPATHGGWSLEDETYAGSYPLGEERNQAERAVIAERLADKGQVAALAVRKFRILWGEADAAAYWALLGTDKQSAQLPLIQAERLMYLLLAAFGCAAFVGLLAVGWRSGTVAAAGVLLPLLVLGGYAAIHLVIEVQPRYRLDVLPLFAVASGYGAVWLRQTLAVGGRRRGMSDGE